ncbi:AGAP011197-PA-like protein [Anopheles sinensis]|uniref:AGAP011197-PA-like protein n=1 Tax=Anopheles sinensis TaxID=74873 RepID=A0A084VGQ7_ANOSI|nr:AGAP011197-PA-like protein [Anopheles sinensis]
MAKLDYLQYKLNEVDLGLKERNEEFAEKLQKIETSIETHSQKILAQQTACANHERMRNEISQLTQKLNHRNGPYTSCTGAPESVSGVYLIQVSVKSSPFEAFCEQNSFGGGWLVIQYRYDGSLDFYRDWAEYRNGFGSPYQEYWLGLERLYQLTSQGPYELLVELKSFNGTYSYAQYNEFEIASESKQYSLKKLGAFSGTAEDALSRQKGRKFSTKDRDNDITKEDCAVTRHGAWWDMHIQG